MSSKTIGNGEIQHPVLKVCVAQMTSTNNHEGNIRFLEKAAAFAHERKCDLLALPEVAGLMNRDAGTAQHQITSSDKDPYIDACSRQAIARQLWIHTGSTPVVADNGKFFNHSNLIDSAGAIRASYDKIHLFDYYPKEGRAICESKRYQAGQRAVLASTPWGAWGMSVCYDLRFPHLYRDYAKAGAMVQFVPSAFTRSTGEAHWEVLLRARAIENGCYIIAAAQVGCHDDGRQTWGHSMVVNPWGDVLLDMGGEEPGMAVVDLDMSAIEHTQSQIPSLANERPYQLERN